MLHLGQAFSETNTTKNVPTKATTEPHLNNSELGYMTNFLTEKSVTSPNKETEIYIALL